MPRLDGTTHVNLTVTDLDRSAPWYCRVFGFVVVNDVTPPGSGFRFRTLLDPASFSSIVLGRPDDVVDTHFNEQRVGLHHLGFHVPERDDLDAWGEHLDAIGVEHSEIIISGHEAGAQIWFRDPDNIWLEVYWANKAFFRERLKQRWREANAAGRRLSLSDLQPA